MIPMLYDSDPETYFLGCMLTAYPQPTLFYILILHCFFHYIHVGLSETPCVDIIEQIWKSKTSWPLTRIVSKLKIAIFLHIVDKFTSMNSEHVGFLRSPWERPLTPECVPGASWGPWEDIVGSSGVLGGSSLLLMYMREKRL